MSVRRVLPMYMRDLRDAIRDGRILIAILIPVALAVFYGLSFPDADELPRADMVVVGDRGSEIVEQIRDSSAASIDLTVKPASNVEEARKRVQDHPADTVAMVLPPEVDADAAAGRRAEVQLIIDSRARGVGRQLAAQVELAVSSAGAVPPPLTIAVEQVGTDSAETSYEVLGVAAGSIIVAVVMLASFVAFLAVPVLLMEEVQLGTLEALQLVASTWEIIVAKVLVGLTYCAIAIALTMALVQIEIASPTLFVVAALVLSLVLVGFGLAFGLALGDPGRVNTWSGVIILPLIVPTFLVLDGTWSYAWLLELIPPGGGTLLLAEAIDPASVTIGIAPIIALAAWTIGGFGLLWWLLDRQQ